MLQDKTKDATRGKEMKKIFALILGAAMILAFTACGSENISDDTDVTQEPVQDEVVSVDFPLEEMYAANRGELLLEKYGTVRGMQSFYDVDGSEFRYISINMINEDGELSGEINEQLINPDGNKFTYNNWFKGKDGNGYRYTSDKGVLAAFIYPKADYNWGVTSQWDSIFYYSQKEIPTAVTEEEDKLVVTTHYESADDGKYFDGTYTMDKSSYEILDLTRTYYKPTGEESYSITTLVDCGNELNFEKKAYEECTAGKTCEYTLSIFPSIGAEESEDHTFIISQDCPVYLTARGSNFAYYSDRDCTDSVDVMPPKGKNVHYWARCTDEEHNSYVEGLDAALAEAEGIEN